ncbi:hypothetical protein HQ560_11945 [bacterium]|nr:hypothetical protein [bacterium]
MRLHVFLACALALAWIPSRAGQPHFPPTTNDNPFLALAHALKTAPAPPWVKTGMRLTYYMSTASVPADRQHAVLDLRNYAFVAITGGPGPVLAVGGACVSVPGGGGDYWLSPAVLQQFAPSQRPGLTITRGPYPIEGRLYQALRFQRTGPRSRTVHVYDLVTGILLHTNSSITTQSTAMPRDPRTGDDDVRTEG